MKYILSNSNDKFDTTELSRDEVIMKQQVGHGEIFTEVSDEQYEKLVKHELRWENGKLVSPNRTSAEISEELRQRDIASKRARLSELKGLLASWDYKTSKHADGDYTEAEWAAIVVQRKAWREEIRALETQLANI